MDTDTTRSSVHADPEYIYSKMPFKVHCKLQPRTNMLYPLQGYNKNDSKKSSRDKERARGGKRLQQQLEVALASFAFYSLIGLGMMPHNVNDAAGRI